MRYTIYFRHGGQVTVESRRTLDEISDFFTEIANSDTPIRAWGVMADGDIPTALVSIIDVIAIVPDAPAAEPAAPAERSTLLKDLDGDVWEETYPGSKIYKCLDQNMSYAYSRESIERLFGPVEVLTSPA